MITEMINDASNLLNATVSFGTAFMAVCGVAAQLCAMWPKRLGGDTVRAYMTYVAGNYGHSGNKDA